MAHLIKNMEPSQAIVFKSLVEYGEGQVVSRTLSQGKHVSVTLFAFDRGEEISSHSSGGDALVYILEGTASITIGQDAHTVREGEAILMPAKVNHALLAEERFKMLLVVVFPSE
jgi:Uncharacterized conserved protein, contains double-stranded beta-helix domain